MNFAYITRADISAKSAQARQISCMSKSFHDCLGQKFILVSAGSNAAIDFNHKILRTQKSSKLRYLEACLIGVLGNFKYVYTREVAVAFFACLVGKKVTLEVHRDPVGFLPKMLMSQLRKFPNFKLVAISDALAKYMIKTFDFSKEKVLTAHDGVFVEDYQNSRLSQKEHLKKELQIPVHEKLIVHTGSLYKGGAELFGYAVMPELFGQLLFLHIGGSSDECNYWTDFYKEKNIHNVLFRSHTSFEEIKGYQLCADALFYMSVPESPIHWCTSPLKIFEYMASKTPIIASTAGSVGEVLNEDNCFPFAIDNKLSIANAVESLFSNEKRSELRSQVAFEEVLKKYRWETRVENILKFSAVNF